MAAFDLFSADGLRLADRYVRAFNLQYIARDPLSGVVDSSNTVFNSTYRPILSSGSQGVRLGGVLQSGSSYTVEAEQGVFIFNTAPSVQPIADYTIAAYPDRLIRSVMVVGFDEMELLWFRGLALSETQGTGQIILSSQDSNNAYVVNSSGSDPPIGNIFFSTSWAQRALYGACVQLAFVKLQIGEYAPTHFIWQEAQGLRVDKSMTVRNLQAFKDNLEKSLAKKLEQAQVEVYGEGSVYGAFIADLHTKEFLAHRFWERASKDEGWRDSTTYTGYGY